MQTCNYGNCFRTKHYVLLPLSYYDLIAYYIPANHIKRAIKELKDRNDKISFTENYSITTLSRAKLVIDVNFYR